MNLKLNLTVKGGSAMITWETEMTQALERGLAEKKPILLDFFNPG